MYREIKIFQVTQSNWQSWDFKPSLSYSKAHVFFLLNYLALREESVAAKEISEAHA